MTGLGDRGHANHVFVVASGGLFISGNLLNCHCCHVFDDLHSLAAEFSLEAQSIATTYRYEIQL